LVSEVPPPLKGPPGARRCYTTAHNH